MHQIRIENFDLKINFEVDEDFIKKNKKHNELKTLLETELLPKFLSTSLPIIKHVSNIINCKSFNLYVYHSCTFSSSYMNVTLSANINDEFSFYIGHYFFHNYLNKSDNVCIDINLEIKENNIKNSIKSLNNLCNIHYNLDELKYHLKKLFNILSINDFYLNFQKNSSYENIIYNKNFHNKISHLFDKTKEKEYYDSFRNKNPIANNLEHSFEITNIVNKNGIFKMIEFEKENRRCLIPADNYSLTKVFYNLTDSIEDSFIRGLIYDDFFNSTVIDTYLNEGKISLHEMLELQNITEY